jgi:hypothetical protein
MAPLTVPGAPTAEGAGTLPRAMVHLRIVSPPDITARVMDVLTGSEAVINIIRLDGAARRPDGDVILCEDASVVVGDLSPDAFTVIVALCAGAAGMLSLSTAKSGALIGVLISVTTMPAAANIGIAAAYGDAEGWVGSMTQLALNLTSIVVAGTVVLAVQRTLYSRRRSARAQR